MLLGPEPKRLGVLLELLRQRQEDILPPGAPWVDNRGPW